VHIDSILLEHVDPKRIKDSESIDIGDEQVGKQYGKTRKVECLKCPTKMIPLVDRTQIHIKYESCTVCYGVFFDAGELKDFKEEAVLESLKQMMGMG